VLSQYLGGKESTAKLAGRCEIGERVPNCHRDALIAANSSGATRSVDGSRRARQREQAVTKNEQIIGDLTNANSIPGK
jgi:hypothetical protein